MDQTARDVNYLTVGEGAAARRIAYMQTPATTTGAPGLVWLGGFSSDMTGTKASALDAWAAAQGLAFLRFDYSGHGASDGRFEDGTIGLWLEDAMAALRVAAKGPQILIGSSMGAWIALLILRALARGGPAADGLPPAAGAVLIAPAWDMTHELMWKTFPEEVRRTLETEGVYFQPTDYEDGPYPITRALIEEGRAHLIAETPFHPGCPVRILQGLNDPDVPWEHASRLNSILTSSDVETDFIPDGDHRLSRPEDIERLQHTIATLVAGA